MKPKVFNSENLSEILETKDHLSVDDMAEDFEFVLKSDIEKLRNELIRLEYVRINFTKDYICKEWLYNGDENQNKFTADILSKGYQIGDYVEKQEGKEEFNIDKIKFVKSMNMNLDHIPMFILFARDQAFTKFLELI